MKLITFFMVCIFFGENAYAQNWLLTGNTATDTSINYLGTSDNTGLKIKTNNTDRVWIGTNGRVGINTNAPSYNLEVANSAAVTLGIRSATASATMNMDRGLATGNAAFAYKSVGTTLWNSGLLSNDNFTIRNVVSGTNVFVISTANNVGIGIGSPTQKLDVVGNGKFSGTLKVGAYTLPATDGTNAQVLKTNGSGTLTWSADNNNIYTQGAGINITGLTISNTDPDQVVSLTGTGDAVVTGTYPNFTIDAPPGWNLNGNAGINPVTAFLGTTDNSDVVIKTNNVSRMIIKSTGGISIVGQGSGNTFLGASAGNNNNGGYNNTFLGWESGKTNTTGFNNVSVGNYAFQASYYGDDNVAIGSEAMYANTEGDKNVAIGSSALKSNNTGTANCAIGMASLQQNTSGFENTAIGYRSLYTNNNGADNVAVGYNAMSSNSNGSNNAALGVGALGACTNGSNNTAVGSSAMALNSSGSNNSALGSGALSGSAGSFNTACGALALSNNSGGGNNALGYYALFSNIGGGANCAFGNNALYANTSGAGNVAIGYQALYNNTTLSDNVAIGYLAASSQIGSIGAVAIGSNALRLNQGGANIAIGYHAMEFNNTGSNNTTCGTFSLYNNTTGSYNTSFGFQGLYKLTSGNFNSTFGCYSGYSLQTGISNIALGYNALYTDSTGNDNVAIGQGALFYNNANANTAVGTGAMNQNKTGTSNVAVGNQSLQFNTTGSNNTGIGNAALGKNISANKNSAVGALSLYNDTTGKENTAVGYNTLFATSLGNNNVAMGESAGAVNTTGSGNTFIGDSSGIANTTGNQNTFLGYRTNAGSSNLLNATAVGYNANVNSSNCMVFGNNTVTQWGMGVTPAVGNIIEFPAALTTAKLTTGGAWTDASARALKENFQELDKQQVLNDVMKLNITKWNYKKDDATVKHIGPVAEEFYELFKTGDDKSIAAMDKAGVALIAIQALKEENNALRKSLEKAETSLTIQQQQIDELKSSVEQCCFKQQKTIEKNETLMLQNSFLYQNKPNPFTQTTTITYFIFAEAKKAIINIVSENGVLIKSLKIEGRGLNQIEINGNSLASGIYNYQLIVDDRIVDVKKMVLTK